MGGAIADRLGVARVATWTLVARVVLMLVFGVVLVSGSSNIATLTGIAVFAGLIDALHMPALGGIGSLLGSTGEQADMQATFTSVRRMAQVAGGALGGALLGWAPLSVGPIAGALLLIAAVALWLLRRRASAAGLVIPAPERRLSVASMIREGLQAVWGEPMSRLALSLFGVANMSATAIILLGLPLKAVANHWAPWAYGLAAAALSAGYIVGGVLLKKRLIGLAGGANVRSAIRLLSLATVGLVGIAVTASPIVAGICAVVVGLFLSPAVGLLYATIYDLVPVEMRGRATSVVTLAIYVLIPVGQGAFSALAGPLSLVGAALALTAILGLALAVASKMVLPRLAAQPSG